MKRNFIKKHLKALTIIGVLLSCTLVTGMLATTINRQEEVKNDAKVVKELDITMTKFNNNTYNEISNYYDSRKIPQYFYKSDDDKSSITKNYYIGDLEAVNNAQSDITYYGVYGIVDKELTNDNLTIDNNLFPMFNPVECNINNSCYVIEDKKFPLTVNNKTGVTHYTGTFSESTGPAYGSIITEFNFRLNSDGKSYGESGKSEDTCLAINTTNPTFVFIDGKLVLEMWTSYWEQMKGVINFSRDGQYAEFYNTMNEPFGVSCDSNFKDCPTEQINGILAFKVDALKTSSRVSLESLNLYDGKEHTIKIFSDLKRTSDIFLDMNFQEDSDLNINKVVDTSDLNSAFNLDDTFDVSIENKLSNNNELQYTDFASTKGVYSKGGTFNEHYTFFDNTKKSCVATYLPSSMSFGDNPSYLKLGSNVENITDITNYLDYIRFSTAQSHNYEVIKLGICLEDMNGCRVFGWCNDYVFDDYSNILNSTELVNFKVDLAKLLKSPNMTMYTTENYKDFDVSKLKGFYLISSSNNASIFLGDIYFGHLNDDLMQATDNRNNLVQYLPNIDLLQISPDDPNCTCALPNCLLAKSFTSAQSLSDYKYIKFKMQINNEDISEVLNNTKIYICNKANVYTSSMHTKCLKLNDCIIKDSLVSNNREISGFLDLEKIMNTDSCILTSWKRVKDQVVSDTEEQVNFDFDVSKVSGVCIRSTNDSIEKIEEFTALTSLNENNDLVAKQVYNGSIIPIFPDNTCNRNGIPCLISGMKYQKITSLPKYIQIDFTTSDANDLSLKDTLGYLSFTKNFAEILRYSFKFEDVIKEKTFTELSKSCKYSVVLDVSKILNVAEKAEANSTSLSPSDCNLFCACITDTSNSIARIDAIYTLSDMPEMNLNNELLYNSTKKVLSSAVANLKAIKNTEALNIGDYNNYSLDEDSSISPISQIQGENIDSQDGHFQIKNGEYVHIANQLSPSTDYKVTENLTDIQKLLYDTKWTVTNTDGTEVSGEGTKTDDIKMASISTAIDTKAVFANVTFTNTLKTHQLVVKKETKVNTDKVFKFNIKFKFNNDADFRVYENLAYDILDADGNMIQSTISNDGTFTLAQNQRAVFKGLPNTIEYQINEEVDKDFALFKVSISDTFDENTKIVNGKIEDADDYATFINAPINVSPVGPNDKVEVETPEGNVNISTETSTPKKETQTVGVLQDKPIIEQVLTGDDTRIALIVIVLIISGGLVIVLAKRRK